MENLERSEIDGLIRKNGSMKNWEERRKSIIKKNLPQGKSLHRQMEQQ